jgi:paraquat-inducible protein B
MTTRPAIVGGFILGALALGVAATLLFGGARLFATTSRVVVFFNEPVAGLDVGAPVTFKGARIGSVRNIAIQFSTDTLTARIPVILELQPEKIVWEGGDLGKSLADYRRLVQAGLRAQLALQSLVTGQLSVDLEFRPNTSAGLVGTMPDIPEIPSVPSELGQLRNEVANLPLRDLANAAEKALVSVGHLSDRLDARLDPLIDSTQRAADAATHVFGTADKAVLRLQTDASTALHDLDLLVVDARRQVNVRGGEVSQTLAAVDRAADQANKLLVSLNGLADPHGSFRDNLESAARDLAATSGSLRGFAETVERNPNTLLLGRGGR